MRCGRCLPCECSLSCLASSLLIMAQTTLTILHHPTSHPTLLRVRRRNSVRSSLDRVSYNLQKQYAWQNFLLRVLAFFFLLLRSDQCIFVLCFFDRLFLTLSLRNYKWSPIYHSRVLFRSRLTLMFSSDLLNFNLFVGNTYPPSR